MYQRIFVQEDNEYVLPTNYCELDKKIEDENIDNLEKGRELVGDNDSGFASANYESSEEEMSEIGICDKMDRDLLLEDSDFE
jgi:hypothetical protein